MLLNAFPDINMVRQLKNNAARGEGEWRNVVLNFRCREAERLRLESPYSFFINQRGHSHCRVNGNSYRVETDSFLFSQPGDIYGLTIDNMQQTEICNVHISKRFFDNVAYTLLHPHDQLLHEPETMGASAHLYSQLYRRNDKMNGLLLRLTDAETYNNGLFEPLLMRLVENILLQNNDVQQRIANLPFVRASVRDDIYRRLALGKDYIYSNYDTLPDLDAVCRTTGMSKFHFLRLFKAQYGVTPHQYLLEVRMEKALQLLKHTNESIQGIAAELGYEYVNSFIKAFQKVYHTSPLQYRKQEISNFG